MALQNLIMVDWFPSRLVLQWTDTVVPDSIARPELAQGARYGIIIKRLPNRIKGTDSAELHLIVSPIVMPDPIDGEDLTTPKWEFVAPIQEVKEQWEQCVENWMQKLYNQLMTQGTDQTLCSLNLQALDQLPPWN